VEELLRATAAAEAQHFWFRGFRAFVRPLIRIALNGTKAPRILDCGCGTGANLGLLGRFGYAVGFDLSEVGPRLAREAGRTGVVRGTVTAAPFLTAAFDLVTSFDVLYALDDRDEADAVAELYRLLKPGGFALVNVAALPMLTGDHSVLSHEQRRYTRAALRRVLERGGFSIVRLTYTNATLFLPLAALRWYHRRRGLAGGTDARGEIAVPPAPINGAVCALLWLESLWLRVVDNPFGSSLLCLARKPVAGEGPR
jgi:SAM-dependent methyltransferase